MMTYRFIAASLCLGGDGSIHAQDGMKDLGRRVSSAHIFALRTQ